MTRFLFPCLCVRRSARRLDEEIGASSLLADAIGANSDENALEAAGAQDRRGPV